MIDTLNVRLRVEDNGGVDFLAETPCHLNNIGEHNYSGDIFLTGELQGLKVSLSKSQMKIKDGSLCKWYLGDNQKTMTRKDIERAVERLSDSLHLPISKAEVTRLDLAQNLSMKYPIEVYLSHLGELRNYKRVPMVQIGSLYYCHTGTSLNFYDKTKELKDKREKVDDLYKDKNILRYELRYTKQIAKQLNINEVKCCSLYEEGFYIDLLNRWRNSYLAIEKINDVVLNFGVMKTKRDLYILGVKALIERVGGEINLLDQLSEAQKQGLCTNKQAHDLRKKIKSITQDTRDLTAKSEVVEELTEKVKQSVKFYR